MKREDIELYLDRANRVLRPNMTGDVYIYLGSESGYIRAAVAETERAFLHTVRSVVDLGYKDRVMLARGRCIRFGTRHAVDALRLLRRHENREFHDWLWRRIRDHNKLTKALPPGVYRLPEGAETRRHYVVTPPAYSGDPPVRYGLRHGESRNVGALRAAWEETQWHAPPSTYSKSRAPEALPGERIKVLTTNSREGAPTIRECPDPMTGAVQGDHVLLFVEVQDRAWEDRVWGVIQDAQRARETRLAAEAVESKRQWKNQQRRDLRKEIAGIRALFNPKG